MALPTREACGPPPGGRDLAKTLGRTHALWTRLHAEIADAFGPLEEKWSFSKKSGRWSLQLKQRRKKRTVLYLIVQPGHFLAAFALGEKACAAARASGLPDSWLEAIDSAPRYAEGRGVWLEIRRPRDVANAARLAALKMAN